MADEQTTIPEGSASSTSEGGWIVLHTAPRGGNVTKVRLGRVETLELIRDLSESLEDVICA